MKCKCDEKLRENKKVRLSSDYSELKKGMTGKVVMCTYERFIKNKFHTQCHIRFTDERGRVTDRMIPTKLLIKI